MFVEQFPSLEAVEELADHAVEQVPLCLCMSVPALASTPVVGVRSGRGLQRGEGPEEAGVVEPVVLHSAAADVVLLAGGAGDGGRARVCLEAAGVGEPGAVVSDLGEHPGAELDAETGKAEDHVSVRVLRESLLHRLGEVVSGCAGGLQLPQQGEHLLTERVLDQRRLVSVVAAEDLQHSVGLGLDAPSAAGSLECGTELSARQQARAGRSRRDGEDGAGFGPAEAVGPDGEGLQGGWVVLAQQRAELVGQLLPVPDRILLGSGEHGDGLGEVADGARLTIHMNAAVRPDWDTQTAARIVVKAGVLLDRATLQRLSYVHRIRCDSHGTSRRVLIGTETARGTQWFTPEQCSLGPAGLMTPALENLPNRPIARLAGPQSEAHDQPARISPEVAHLLVRLATARQGRDITNTRKLINECDILLGRRTSVPAVLRQARDSAEQWLLERSKEIVTWNRKGKLVVLTGGGAKQETDRQARQAQKATEQRKEYLAELKVALEHERFGDVRGLLRAISQLPDSDVPLTRAQIDFLKGARSRVYGGGLGKLQDQVARKKWLQRHCPKCKAHPGQECFDEVPDSQPLRRFGGHDERLQLVIASREEAAARNQAQRHGVKASRGTTTEDLARSVSHVPCPTCKAPAGRPCPVPGSHESCFQRAQSQRRQ